MTLTVRRRFEQDLGRRFRRLMQVIREALIERDVLGLLPLPDAGGGLGRVIQAMSAEDSGFDEDDFSLPPHRAFDYPRSDEKVQAFMAWVRRQLEAGVLQARIVEGERRPIRGTEPWTNLYLRSSYQRGIQNARQEMNAGLDEPRFRVDTGTIAGQFNREFHADRVGLLFSRTFTELAGVTEEMARRMNRELAEGMAEGLHPRDIAREMSREVGVGIKRARTIARTEMIRAHHQATINEYRHAMDISEVEVRAEWNTAGDDRVCPKCEAMDGRRFTLEEIEPLIPFHPNCRCVAIPVVASSPPSRFDSPEQGESDDERQEALLF